MCLKWNQFLPIVFYNDSYWFLKLSHCSLIYLHIFNVPLIAKQSRHCNTELECKTKRSLNWIYITRIKLFIVFYLELPYLFFICIVVLVMSILAILFAVTFPKVALWLLSLLLFLRNSVSVFCYFCTWPCSCLLCIHLIKNWTMYYYCFFIINFIINVITTT
jgi:hypothetical protein